MKTDRIVVITGAGGEMGRLAVERFLANGDTVIGSDSDSAEQALQKLIDAQPSDAKLHTVVADISKEDDCKRVAGPAQKAGGRVDVLVNVVTPGLTVTPAVKAHMPPELIEQQVKLRAIPRDETGEDLIGAIFFLASPDAEFISGQTINVDGGKHIL